MDIYSEKRDVLLSLDFIEGLAIRHVELDLSRLGATNWLARQIYTHQGRFMDWNGRQLYLDLNIIDRSYGNDPSGTWNSEIKRFAFEPPQRRPRHSLLLRLCLWDLALKRNRTPVLK